MRKEETKIKGTGDKERYTHLNAEFQRIARRDKKAFLSDQCKEIEENKRLFYTSVSLLLSCIQGYRYHLSKFHTYVLEY